jgi:sugar O-acyltransferase (sialic acid O-acetyltransferase NeuD family)
MAYMTWGAELVRRSSPIILIGAGGHSKELLRILGRRGITITGYIDDRKADWLHAGRPVQHLTEADLRSMHQPAIIIGFGGVTPESLERRYHTMQEYRSLGAIPSVTSANCLLSDGLRTNAGIHILHRVVVNCAATIGDGVILNTGAIVEHDADIGNGTHVAPGAIVLGGATVGKHCLIGAGAIVVQGAMVPDRTFVKAGTLWKRR